jgi:cytochrome c peroxidase
MKLPSSIAAVSALSVALGVYANTESAVNDAAPLLFRNASGVAATFSTAGPLETSNPFFQKLGVNGRSCDTCHQPRDAWSITPDHLQARFRATEGRDAIFRLNDGANSPDADVSTPAAMEQAYSMLLTKGLIRVGIGIPADAEFELAQVDDPYGYASARELSLFRRPAPAANLRFINAVMWDGRETLLDPASSDCIAASTTCFAPLHFSLAGQANAATAGHAQAATPLSDEQRAAIVRFEMSVFVAQLEDDQAGRLDSDGAQGGPEPLPHQPTYFGINDVLWGDYRTGAPFDPQVFKLYTAWATPKAQPGDDSAKLDARASIARGEALFNGRAIRIAGVKGINDDLGVPVLDGTCSTCHDTPGGGNHSIPMALDIGISDASRATPDLPLYVLRHKVTGESLATTDPGRALVTGKWKDIGRFKGPVLRALAARPPYFHNGSAADLHAVVDFYNERFEMRLTPQEREDLAAFLRTL